MRDLAVSHNSPSIGPSLEAKRENVAIEFDVESSQRIQSLANLDCTDQWVEERLKKHRINRR
jgi:hypothetical protein